MNLPMCYIFGYGSLMYPSGINGRGMEHMYTWDDLVPCELIHYKRGMYAYYNRIAYYGLVRESLAKTNGVLVPIFSNDDYEVLLLNEGAHISYNSSKAGRMYTAVDITPYITFANTLYKYNVQSVFSVPTMTLINSKGSVPYKPTPWYTAHVWSGIQPWGDYFIDMFLSSGGVKATKGALCTAWVHTAIKKVKKIHKAMSNGSY